MKAYESLWNANETLLSFHAPSEISTRRHFEIQLLLLETTQVR